MPPGAELVAELLQRWAALDARGARRLARALLLRYLGAAADLEPRRRAALALAPRAPRASRETHSEHADTGRRQRARRQRCSSARPLWRAGRDARAARLARGRTDDADDAARLADDYRLLAHDLARARALIRPAARASIWRAPMPGRTPRCTTAPGASAATLRRLFARGNPGSDALARALHCVDDTASSCWSGCGGYALVHRYPELIALFASPDLIASVESGKLWTQGLLNVVPSSVLSVQILANNIVVSLFAYCLGFLFGLGTLYILGLNGLMLGAVFAFVGAARTRRRSCSASSWRTAAWSSRSCASRVPPGRPWARRSSVPGDAGRPESFRAAALRSGWCCSSPARCCWWAPG